MAEFPEFTGLSQEWEGVETVWERIRVVGDMFKLPVGSKWVEPSRANAVTHSDILLPALRRLATVDEHKLPYMAVLDREITALYKKLGKTTSSDIIYRNAQEIKRLLGFLKRKATRKELTKDHLGNPVVQSFFIGFITGR